MSGGWSGGRAVENQKHRERESKRGEVGRSWLLFSEARGRVLYVGFEAMRTVLLQIGSAEKG